MISLNVIRQTQTHGKTLTSKRRISLTVSIHLPPLSFPPFHRLTHSRAWPSACVFQGEIYVTGGYDGQHRLRTVEKFDAKNKQWSQIADMNEFRAGCGSAVL